VPLFYAVDHRGEMNVLYIDRLPSRFSGKIALIRIDFHRQPPVMPDTPQGEELLQQLGIRNFGRHKLRLADREGTCVDFIPIPTGVKDDTLAAARVPSDFYNIQCTFGENLGVNFNGTQDAIADFYAIIKSGETVKGEH
jgi:hypothetical protein